MPFQAMQMVEGKQPSTNRLIKQAMQRLSMLLMMLSKFPSRKSCFITSASLIQPAKINKEMMWGPSIVLAFITQMKRIWK